MKDIAMGLQQVTCIVFCGAMVRSCTRLSWFVLYFVVLCTHLLWCDCWQHAVGKRCSHHDVLITLTMLLQHILKTLGSSWYKITHDVTAHFGIVML